MYLRHLLAITVLSLPFLSSSLSAQSCQAERNALDACLGGSSGPSTIATVRWYNDINPCNGRIIATTSFYADAGRNAAVCRAQALGVNSGVASYRVDNGACQNMGSSQPFLSTCTAIGNYIAGQ